MTQERVAADATAGDVTVGEPSGLAEQLTEHAEAIGLEAVVPTPEQERRLALLWAPQEPSTRGRPARFTLDEVVTAGVAVADAEGLAGVTMRRVAREVGAGAMSLYTYVPGRDELLDLMIDAAYAELDLPDGDGSWRDGLIRYADSFLSLYSRHPWLLDLNQWRLPLAPHVLDAEEAGLRVLAATPLEPAQVVGIRDLLETFVHGLARESAKERRDGADTGINQDDYWSSQSHFWETYFDTERYPTMTRMWLSGAFETDRSGTEKAIEPLLEAVERAIAAVER
ncbi:TetR/AcrR family transcriptional regulator [Serinibacter arcticus]|nr:TetR/AcrR family transcriptional regulator [Serinibacter arcticus]